MDRKLAAILLADVVGYSRLISSDEEATLSALDASRDVFKEGSVSHGGRVVDMTGDSVLGVFKAATAAVKAAQEIQIGLSRLKRPAAGDQCMQFRIGVDLGEVIEKSDGTIYGEGVNVAARLGGLAEPGGICVSGRVLEQVEGKLDIGFARLGEQSIKNITKPVDAYQVLLEAQDAGKMGGVSERKISSHRWLMAVVIALIVAAGAFFYYRQKPEFEPASVERMAHTLPDKPLIAVLPFENYSDDEKMDFFVSGLTEDLAAALSKASGLFVIARNSAAAYKGFWRKAGGGRSSRAGDAVEPRASLVGTQRIRLVVAPCWTQ